MKTEKLLQFLVKKEENQVKLPDFQQLIKDKKITSKTTVFNNMVNTKEDFETNWEVAAKDSWHKRFLV